MDQKLLRVCVLAVAIGTFGACSSSNGGGPADGGGTDDTSSSNDASETPDSGGGDDATTPDATSDQSVAETSSDATVSTDGPTEGSTAEASLDGLAPSEAGIDGASDGSPSDATASGLNGATVTFGVYEPAVSHPISQQLMATVGPTIEFPNIENDALSGYTVAAANVDIGPSSIDIQYHQNPSLVAASATFNGYVFSFSPTTSPTIQGASLDGSSTYSASQVVVTFSPHTVSINVQGQTITDTSSILVDLTF